MLKLSVINHENGDTFSINVSYAKRLDFYCHANKGVVLKQNIKTLNEAVEWALAILPEDLIPKTH